MSRCRKYWINRRRIKRFISEAIINDLEDGVLKRKFSWTEYVMEFLLVSGANVTVLGKDCEKLVSFSAVRFHNYNLLYKLPTGNLNEFWDLLLLMLTFKENHIV